MHDKLPSKLPNKLPCRELEQDMYSNSKISNLSTKYVGKMQTKTPIKTWHSQNVNNSKLYREELTSNNLLYQFEKEKSFEKNGFF